MLTAHVSEAEFQRAVTELCSLLGLRWHHETDSRKSKAGFPDLVIVGRGVIFAELKRQAGRIRPEQQEWMSALRLAGAEVHVWRPTDMRAIAKRLRALAGKEVT